MACHRHLFDHRLLQESGRKSISSPTTLSSSSAAATFPRTREEEECKRKTPRRLLLSLNPLIYVLEARGSQSMAGHLLAVSLLLLSSLAILPVDGKQFEDCEKTSLFPGSSDISLSCKLRTINSEFDKTNFSALDSGDALISLNLECSDILFYQSSLQPGSLAHLSRLQALHIEHCKLSRLSPGVFAGLSQLKNLTIRTHNTRWTALSLDLAPGLFNETSNLENIQISENNCWHLPERLFCMNSLQHLNLSTNRLQDISDLGFGDAACESSLKVLDVSQNRFIVFKKAGLSSLSQLAELYIQSNEISVVQDDALFGLTKLKLFNASDNRIAFLPKSLFEYSKGLREIYLRNNSLEDISTLFFELEHLLVLDLSFNSISNITGRGSFNRLIRLVSLDISHNELLSLGVDFNDLYSLQIFNCEYNSIEHIEPFAFSSMKNLHTLILSHNKIKAVSPNVFNLVVLSLLSLDYNNISEIHPDAFKNASSLKDLNLNGNFLKTIPLAIRNLTLLKTIDLGENSISSVSAGQLVGLTSLYGLRLSGNEIETVSKGFISELGSVRVINLARNRIVHVEDGAFDANINLQALRLDANYLSGQINLSSLPNLIWANLSDNALTSLDPNSLPLSLQWLDVHKNPDIEVLNLGPLYNLQYIDASYCGLLNITASSIPDSAEHLFFHNNYINFVEPETFFMKKNLQRVELYQNELSYIDLSIFKISTKFATENSHLPLPEFYIGGNALTCDCGSEWMKRMNDISALRQYGRISDLDALICRFYDESIMPVYEAEDSKFLCKYKTHCESICHCCEYQFCDCRSKCPEGCDCLRSATWDINTIRCLNATDLRTLPMDATHLEISVLELVPHMFIGKRSLVSMYLNNSGITQIQNMSLNGLTGLETLRLNNNRLTEISGYEFGHDLVNLKNLYLDHNKIKFIAKDSFVNLRMLRILTLNNNMLRMFAMWELPQSHDFTFTMLANNPWSCNCDFISQAAPWIQTNLHKIIDANELNCRLNGRAFSLVYMNGTKCSEIIAMSGSSSESDNETKLPPYLPLLAAVMAILLLIGTVFVTVCRKRNSLRIWAITKCYQTYAADDDEREKLYDAYVIYSLKDEMFAAELQQQFNHPYRLCLHYKDFPVTTAYIADSIVEAVECSKRTVIILSKSFLQSEWRNFEYKSALHAALRGKQNRLVAITLGEILTKDLDPDLRLCLQYATVLTAPSTNANDKRFWIKLASALPEPRVSARTPNGGSGSICSSSSVHNYTASTLPFISSDSSATSNHFHNLPPPLPPMSHQNSMTMSNHYHHHHHPPVHFFNSNTLGSNGFPTSHLNGNMSTGNGTVSHHNNGVNNNVAANNSDNNITSNVSIPYVPPFPPPNRPPPPFPAPRRPPPPPLWT